MAEPIESFLTAALTWQRAHPEAADEFPGQWVAIGPKGILAHGEELKVVRANAQKQGWTQPLLWKIPPKGILALWWFARA